MDATIIEEPSDILPDPPANIEPCTSLLVEDTNNTKSADFHGKERGTDSIYDALSAVKLDPAVLEAQITVNGKQQKEAEPPHNPAAPAMPSHCSVTSSKVSEIPASKPHLDFKAMVMRQEAALLSLSPQQLDLLMQFTDKMRRQRNTNQRQLECSFCKNNGESTVWYSSHCLKDGRGRVKCPVLRAYTCPVCAATGDRAHTITYCPENMTFDSDNWSDKGSL